MLSEDRVRAMALSLEGAVEMDHHGFPSFRVGGRIFCTLRGEPPRLMVKLDPEDQHNFCAAYPEAIEPVPGGWGRKGATFVRYDRIEETLAETLLRLAWTGIGARRRRVRRS